MFRLVRRCLLVALLPVGIVAPSGFAQADDGAVDTGSIADFRHEEAKAAMDSGDFERARHLYYILLRVNPRDALAQREAGRASHALGQFEFAVQELTRADQLRGHVADPELHYLLGEALFALGRTDEAKRAQALAIREVGPAPTGRMERLWLARSLARRGDLSGADAIYAAMVAENSANHIDDDEVVLSRIEAHTLNRDWRTAESLTRALLVAKPEHTRAREILAWVLEVRGEISEEVAIRSAIADESAPVDFERTVAHGRSLERSHDYRAALARYQEAYALDQNGDPTLEAAIERLQYRLSPETVVGGAFRSDPSGSSAELRIGLAAPLNAEHSFSLTASYDAASSASTEVEANTGTLTAGVLLGRGRPVTGAIMVSGNYHSMSMGEESLDTMHLGSAAEARLGTGRRVQLHARADFNMPWREAANTIREGGRYDGLTAHIYALPLGHRLVVDGGLQVRRMELEDSMATPEIDSHGRQTLIFGGIDYVVQADPTRVARGEILDDEMLWPTYMADSIVLHFRHYEGFTDDEFGERLVLSSRNTIDEVGATVRRTLAGVFGSELRGGTGYDFARDTSMWRVGGALLLSPSTATRFTFSYDLANESTDAFVGRRHIGWLTFHADL